MKKVCSCFMLMLLMEASHSQTGDPCAIAFGPSYSLNPEGNCLVVGNTVPSRYIAERLLGKQVELLEKLVSGQANLTQAVNDLSAATRRLSAASEDLKSSNVAWRKEVLDKAIGDINQIPGLMAQNESLIRALSTVLANDSSFREILKKP